MVIYIGTSTAGELSRGIYFARFDEKTGEIGEPLVAAETPNPTFLALGPGRSVLYSVSEFKPLVAGFAIDRASGRLNPMSLVSGNRTKAPSHVSIDATGQLAVFSHYHAGYVGAVWIRPDGVVGETATVVRHYGHGVNPGRQERPHVHSAIFSPDNRYIAVCDLGVDRIYRYSLDLLDGSLSQAGIPFIAAPGAGPRHSTFSPDGRFLHVVNELNSTVAVYSLTGGDTAIQVESTLPPGFADQNLCAEIRLSPDARFLYVSNRGHDSIAIFRRDSASGRLEFQETVPCGGAHPRHFALSPDGQWLVCANRDTNNLVCFRRDAASGGLAAVGPTREVPLPVCVVFA